MRFVYISSLAAVGPATVAPKKESDQCNPIEAYGESKRDAELRVRNAGIYSTIIRPGAVYGPGDHDFFKLFRLLRHGLNIYATDPRAQLSIIHVDDLVTGIINAALSPTTQGKTYHLATEIVSWEDIHTAICNALSRTVPMPVRIPRSLLTLAGNFGDIIGNLTHCMPLINSQKIKLSNAQKWTCDTTAAHTDFDFNPTTTLAHGMQHTATWYLHQGWLR
jgi:nucleoside-diphosphate-sugar epimerase